MKINALLAAASAASLLGAPALLGTPALAQSESALVTGAADAPDVAALTAPDQRRGRTLSRDGAEVFYEVTGEGAPMVLLHGYPLSGALFSRVRDALDDEFQVITVDHRGYGNSSASGVPGTIETYAEDALAVLDELGIEEAVIGGMSMGGPIVFAMYERDPDRFDGMILIDTTAAAANPAEAGLWKGVAEVIGANGMEPIYGALLPDMLSGETRLREPAIGEYLTAVMKQASPEAGRGGALALAGRPDRTAMLSTIDVPTLVLVGIEDALYSMSVSQGMVDELPNAELAIIPGASHAAIFEAPGESAKAIRDWAARNEDRLSD